MPVAWGEGGGEPQCPWSCSGGGRVQCAAYLPTHSPLLGLVYSTYICTMYTDQRECVHIVNYTCEMGYRDGDKIGMN